MLDVLSAGKYIEFFCYFRSKYNLPLTLSYLWTLDDNVEENRLSQNER